MIPQKPVLHLALMNLRPAHAGPAVSVGDAAVEAILAAFSRLAKIDGVLHLGAVQAASDASTHSLATFAFLHDIAALEKFGTHPHHIEYLRSAVLPQVSDLVTADVEVAGSPPPSYRAAACFCASFRPTTYDWEVRSLFDAAARMPGNTTIGGLATDDRQRFRAAGLALWPDTEDWSPGQRGDSLHRLWHECWGPAATDQAWVVGPATPIHPSAPGAIP
jgi:hypothetical protein